MPILARIIAQRLLLIVLSTLTFLGVNPEVEIKSEDQAQIATEERKEIIQETVPIDQIEITIPIPKINILDIPKADATHPSDIKTPEPTIPKPENKTPTIIISEPTKTSIPQIKESEISKENIVITPPKDTPDTSNTNSIENVIVNILCIKQVGNKINLTTGSGVIVSEKGIVLTNAHVAQHFLLKDAGYNCTLRRENIPTYGFNASPLYISEKWIENNYRQINNSSPTGTGEDDYALLLITSNTNPSLSLPKSFPALSLNINNAIDVGDNVTIAGYPGKITSSLEIAKNTALQTDSLKIREVFTLNDHTIDVVSTNETSMAQRGVSGGGVFKNNNLVGIMVSTNQTNKGFVVNALTLDYINRDLKKETGKNLNEYLSGNYSKYAEDFASVAPHLTELLMRNL